MQPIKRTLAAITAALTLAIGLTAAPAAAQDDDTPQASPLWDSSVIHDLRFTVDPDAYTAMVQAYIDTGDKQYLEADVTIDGRTFHQAGVKLKGQSSLFGITPDTPPTDLSWLIRLDKYVEQDYDGYQRFAVRSNYTSSSLNEALSLRLLEQAGLETTDSFPTAFSVNGETPQLRLIVQEPDKTFDHEHFPAPDGSKDGGTLYKKQWDVDFSYLGDDPDAYDGAWEPKGGDEDNWQPLLEFVDWMNNATDAQFAAELDTRMDTDAFARYLAVEDLILNWDDIDGPGQNGYFRWTPATDLMTIVPWDHNLAYGIFPEPPPPGTFPTAGDRLPMTMQGDFEAAQRTTWGCPCVARALAVPQFRERYEQTFYQLKTELYDSGLAQAALDELAAPLAQSGLIDQANLQQDLAQIEAVFTQDLTPRTGGNWTPAPGDPDDPDDPGEPPTDTGCTAAIDVVNQWGSGWQGNISITAADTDVDGWTLDWTWPGGQRLTSQWNADVTATGSTVSATDVGWNAHIAAGQTIEAWGFVASGTPATPAVTCTAG
ncbi:CotH kinase family protein [Glycomyces arizonensis]|uniref:CotH kinase family protein n=1 Tax=Glycomyces arizonensis TaxID=256035 RepID=UPI00040135CD|nr:CotH kinase family protein [Glycomyces arizonensis]